MPRGLKKKQVVNTRNKKRNQQTDEVEVVAPRKKRRKKKTSMAEDTKPARGKRSLAKKTRQPEWVPEGKRLEDLSPQMRWYYKNKHEGVAPYQKEARGEWPYGPRKAPHGVSKALRLKLFVKDASTGKWTPRNDKAAARIEQLRLEHKYD